MNLTDGLPTSLRCGGVTVHVYTSASFWMRLVSLLERGGNPSVVETSIKEIIHEGKSVCIDTLTHDQRVQVHTKLLWFMIGGCEFVPRHVAMSTKAKERTIDYEIDIDAIYAAFLQSYGIDLFEERNGQPLLYSLHWWRFLALITNMPSGSILTDYYVHYRGMDVAKLPNKTKLEKEHIADVRKTKAMIALDYYVKIGSQVTASKKQPESFIIRKAKELQNSVE